MSKETRAEGRREKRGVQTRSIDPGKAGGGGRDDGSGARGAEKGQDCLGLELIGEA